ncbi:Alpha/Beta hydrolase protein [Gaertneriomyces semiglobifer]|nr:Alpha/Beta hydrolase protein [Gaertneriomyces semiglobifer]
MPHSIPVHHAETLNPLNPPHRTAIRLPAPCRVSIKVNDPLDHEVPGILHKAPQPTTNCAILVSGAGGGVSGPMGMYVSLAARLAQVGVHALRLDYREPARSRYCVPDVIAAIEWMMKTEGCTNFTLAGWSYGGAPVFTVGAKLKERIKGVATVASQTAETQGIKELAPVPILLMHGTGDTCLSSRCSETLYQMYGDKSNSDLVLFPGDDHGLSKNSAAAENKLFAFFCRVLGVSANNDGGQSLIHGAKEGRRVMAEGHDMENESF